MNKEDYLLQTDFEVLKRVVDAVYIVVDRIDDAVNGYFKQLGYLVGKNDNDIFPAEAFT